MSRIVFINWPCWIWKSTLSKRLHTYIKHSFLWEKDTQRRNFSHYKDSKESYSNSWKSILELSWWIMRSCLENKINLIFDWVITDADFLKRMENYVIENWWIFTHILLTASREVWYNRLIERWLWWSLTEEKAISIYNKLSKFNMNVSVIDTTNKSEDDVFEEIISIYGEEKF